MNQMSYLKDKRVMIAASVMVVGFIVYRLAKPSQTTVTMTAEGLGQSSTALIQQAADVAIASENLKMQRDIAMQSMANERYITDAGITMLKENNDAYLTGLESSNQFALASQVSMQDYNLSSQYEQNALSKHIADNQYSLGRESINLQSTQAHLNADTARYSIQNQTQAQIETARLAADSAVKTAKAGKSKSVGCCGLSLSF